MNFQSLRVVAWINYDKAHAHKRESVGGLGGFFDHGMRWADYLARHDPDQHAHLEALRREILAKHYRFGGDVHQQEKAPLFSDDTVGLFSYRAWGDLMAAVWSTAEDREYHYMDFYMDADV